MNLKKLIVVSCVCAAVPGALSTGASELPAEYSRVECVYTQGDQYINTGYYPGPNTIIEGDVCMAGIFVPSNDFGSPFGTADETGQFSANYHNSNSTMMFAWFGPSGQKINSLSNVGLYNGTRVTLGFDATTATFTYGEATLSECAVPKETLTKPFFIGGMMTKGGQVNPFKCFTMYIYRWKIWTGETLERDFVPCVRKQDNVGGLFDLQYGKFYPSEGSSFSFPPSRKNRVAQFPGDSEKNYINFGLIPLKGDFSASAFVKNIAAGNFGWSSEKYGVIFGEGALGAKGGGFSCFIIKKGDENKVDFQIRLNSTTVKDIAVDWVTDDKWHMVTVTHNQESGENCLYVDGESKGTFVQTAATPVSEFPFMVGARDLDGTIQYPVAGFIAEVSLWNCVLGGDEVLQMFRRRLRGTEQGLIGYWRLNDICSGAAGDSVANGSDRHQGSVVGNIFPAAGKIEWPLSDGFLIFLK